MIFRLYLKARLRDQTLVFEKKEAVRLERNRISAEMHDDLGSGLTSIKMLSELLKLRTGQQPPPELQKIAIRSDELVESLNTIVWALNDRNDQLEPMVAYLRSFIRAQFEEHHMELQMEARVSPELAQWEIHGELRRNIFLIVKESIHNIFKHSGADLAKVRIVANSDTLDIWLEDNGKGRNKEESEIIGNGLKNMKERALAVGGIISFTSEAGFRTHFHLPLYNVRVI
jgi:signal transduction histidine kinase